MASKTEIRRKILTYSLVSARMNDDADPIAALEPFFAPIAADLRGMEFAGFEFREEMHSRYGMIFSRDVTEVFLGRLLELGFLRRSEGKLVWAPKQVEVPSQDEGEEFLGRVLTAAKDVICSHENLLKLEFDEGRFLSALLLVILDQNTAVQDAVRAVAKAEGQEGDPDLNFSIEDTWQWAAAEFVSWAQKNDKAIFDWIADLSGTALLTEALVDIRTPSQNQNVRPELTVYLDTPFLMELLGTSGDAAEKTQSTSFQLCRN